jgi:hypothetical protein
MEENTLIVQWVQQCLERRISSYRWAPERLMIQTPDTIAADADRLIGELAAQTANPPVAAQPVIGRAVTVKGWIGAYSPSTTLAEWPAHRSQHCYCDRSRSSPASTGRLALVVVPSAGQLHARQEEFT